VKTIYRRLCFVALIALLLIVSSENGKAKDSAATGVFAKTPNAVPTGNLGPVTYTQAGPGWASDSDYPSRALRIQINVDGTFFDMLTADENNPVLGHSFTYQFSSLGRGQHTIEAIALGVNANGAEDGINASIGSHTWRFFTEDCPFYFAGGALEWCNKPETVQYWNRRQTDTKRLVSDNIAVGIDNSYGGTIFQLYNSDRSVNLVSEHGGAAVQLSLWGDRSSAATLCAEHWKDPFTLNPIQAIGANCSWDSLGNDVEYSAAVPGGWTTRLDDPHHFTINTAPWPGLQYYQTTYLRNGYLQLDYTIVNGNQYWDNCYGLPEPCSPWRDQEMPAIFTGANINEKVYWWDNVLGLREELLTSTHRKIPLEGTEAWWTVCNSANTHCVTAATFSPEIVEASILKWSGDGYMAALGHFRVGPNMTKSWTVYIFPYRFDQQIPGGSGTVRDTIHTLGGGTPTPTNTPTFTPTRTPTNTPTFTPTRTPTNTPTFTNTPTYTPTSTSTPNCPLNTTAFYPHYTDLPGVNDGYQMTNSAYSGRSLAIDLHSTNVVLWYSGVRESTHFVAGTYEFHVNVYSCAPAFDADQVLYTLEYTNPNAPYNPIEIGSASASHWRSGASCSSSDYTVTIATTEQKHLVNKRLRLKAELLLSNQSTGPKINIGAGTYLSTPAYYVCSGSG
jgi:hypothetical protein